MSTIIIFNEKHGDRYFDASAPELLSAACVKVLGERMAEGWYYAPEDPKSSLSKPDQALLSLTDEEVTNLPEAIREDTRSRIANLQKNIRGELREYNREKAWWDAANALLALPKEEAVASFKVNNPANPNSKSTSVAYSLLSVRSDGEYEGLEIRTLEQA